MVAIEKGAFGSPSTQVVNFLLFLVEKTQYFKVSSKDYCKFSIEIIEQYLKWFSFFD